MRLKQITAVWREKRIESENASSEVKKILKLHKGAEEQGGLDFNKLYLNVRKDFVTSIQVSQEKEIKNQT